MGRTTGGEEGQKQGGGELWRGQKGLTLNESEDPAWIISCLEEICDIINSG
jgi:hypothetical protein